MDKEDRKLIWMICIFAVFVGFIAFMFIKGFLSLQEVDSIMADAVEQCEAKGQVFEDMQHLDEERYVKCKSLEGYEKLYVSED